MLNAVQDAAADPRLTYDLAMTIAGDDRLIGRRGLGIDEDQARAAVLWYTLHPDEWGRGYTTEVCRALVDFGFGRLDLHRIWADRDPADIASWRVLEKIGMRREGHLRENTWVKGVWVDSLIYAILDREWAVRMRNERGARTMVALGHGGTTAKDDNRGAERGTRQPSAAGSHDGRGGAAFPLTAPAAIQALSTLPAAAG